MNFFNFLSLYFSKSLCFSHPKYRLALKEKCPCCVFGKVEDPSKASDAQSQATTEGGESKA